MTYSIEDVKKILNDLQDSFIGRLSDGEDSTYAKIFKDARRTTEKKWLSSIK